MPSWVWELAVLGHAWAPVDVVETYFLHCQPSSEQVAGREMTVVQSQQDNKTNTVD